MLAAIQFTLRRQWWITVSPDYFAAHLMKRAQYLKLQLKQVFNDRFNSFSRGKKLRMTAFTAEMHYSINTLEQVTFGQVHFQFGHNPRPWRRPNDFVSWRKTSCPFRTSPTQREQPRLLISKSDRLLSHDGPCKTKWKSKRESLEWWGRWGVGPECSRAAEAAEAKFACSESTGIHVQTREKTCVIPVSCFCTAHVGTWKAQRPADHNHLLHLPKHPRERRRVCASVPVLPNGIAFIRGEIWKRYLKFAKYFQALSAISYY